MKLDNANNSEKREEDLLAILDELENDKSAISKVEIINIAKTLIQEKYELENLSKSLIEEKEEWGKEKKRLIEENNTLKEQLKILRSKQFGKSSEKTRKKIEELEQKIEENEIELELKSSKKKNKEEEKSGNKARRHKLPEELEREEVIIEAPSEVTPMSQTKNDSKRETFFVNY